MKNIADINTYFLSSKTAIIIADGPSINKSKQKIRELYQKKKPIVIAANRTIKKVDTDYLVFIDIEIFQKYMTDIVSNQKIILGPLINNYNHLPNKKFSIIFNDKKKNIKKIEVKKGKILHRIFNCGIACIFVAYFLKMEEIYLFGFDGPSITDKEGYLWHFDGTITNRSEHKCIRMKSFHELVFKFIKKNGIELYADTNCPLWGIDKKLLKIKDC